MTRPDERAEHLTKYLQELTPQVRARLLAELERLHLLGEDIPHSEALIAALRAEFRNTGQSHYRVGNPSRFFFEPLEPVLVDGAPERANCGQVARGSLGPIWSMITEKLLPTMAKEYTESAGKAIAANNQIEVRRIAAALQNKVVTYLEGVLAKNGGLAEVRSSLECYTSSHATFDDLKKMLRVMHASSQLAEFARMLPARIAHLDGDHLAKVLELLNALRAKHADLVPFAITLVARRLEAPWQLIHLATKPAGSKTVARIMAGRYAVAVSMVLDHIDEKRLMLVSALKHNRIPLAKEILKDIYATESAVSERIELGDSDWGKRLQNLISAVDASLDAEINSIPTDHQHLVHVLEALRSHRDESLGARVGRLARRGRDVLAHLWHAAPAN